MIKFMKPYWLLVLMLGSLVAAQEWEEEFSEETRFPLVIGPVSFLSDPEPMEMVRIQQARETVELVARLKGFQPMYPFWQSREMIDYQPSNSLWMRAAANFPENTSHISPRYRDGTLDFNFDHYLYIQDFPIDWVEDVDAFLDYDWEAEHQSAEILSVATKDRLRIWERTLDALGVACDATLLVLDPELSRGDWEPEDFSNLPYWERNARMSEYRASAFDLGLLQHSNEHVGKDLVELTRLNIIQAIYLARFDQVGSARHIGRGLLYADMLLWANPDSTFAKALFEEVEMLALRFSEATRLGESYVPLLPETAQLVGYEEAPLSGEEMAYPVIESLLDYSVSVEVKADRVGRESAIYNYINQNESGLNFLEKLLLAQKDVFSSGMTFNGYMWLNNISNGIYRQHGLGLCRISLQLILDSLGETVSELVKPEDVDDGFPDLLGPHAAVVLDGISPSDLRHAWNELSPLKSLEKNLTERGRLFDSTFEIEAEEIYWEARATHIYYVKGICGRMRSVGAKKSEGEIRTLLSAYGLKGLRLSSGLVWGEGFYPSAKPKSRFQDDLETMANDAKVAYFTGDLEEAVHLFRVLIPVVGDNDSDLMNIAFCAFSKSGRAREGVTLIKEQFSSSFGKDGFRLLLLSLAPEALEMYPDYLYESNTASASDYFAQAESYFRLGRYDDVIAVCQRYHYGESQRIAVLRSLAQWLKFGSPPEDMEILKTQWVSLLDAYNRPQNSFIDTWSDILDDQLGKDPVWSEFKKEMQVDPIRTVLRSEKALYRKLPESALESVLEDLRSITDTFTNKDYDLTWKHFALQYEQYALGESLALRTNGFSVGLENARSEVIELMDKTLRIMDGRPSMIRNKYQPHPLETGWLHAAVKAGADPLALARFVKTLPKPEYYFQEEGLLFVASIPHANMLAEIFENAPHQDSTSDMWASSFDPNGETLLPFARESGIPDLVRTYSFSSFDEKGDFSKLAPLFENRELAVSWIDENAPDRATAKAWLKTFDELDPQESNPVEVPPLYEYLTARDRLAFSRN